MLQWLDRLCRVLAAASVAPASLHSLEDRQVVRKTLPFCEWMQLCKYPSLRNLRAPALHMAMWITAWLRTT